MGISLYFVVSFNNWISFSLSLIINTSLPRYTESKNKFQYTYLGMESCGEERDRFFRCSSLSLSLNSTTPRLQMIIVFSWREKDKTHRGNIFSLSLCRVKLLKLARQDSN